MSGVALTINGAPEAPGWLHPLPAQPPETLRVATGGSEVQLLVWGKTGQPGLFLLHGAGAHAHWWAGVAPLLAEHHRVAAMSLPGNGASDWRDSYSSADFFADALACVEATALNKTGAPIFVGHSMGGAHLMHGAIHAPQSMRGLLLVDTSFRAPGATGQGVPERARRLYAAEAEAIGRFRLSPSGPARESPLVEHAARHALMQMAGPDGAAAWCWRADPGFWSKFERGVEQGPCPVLLRPRIPTVHLIADRSHVAAAIDSLPLGDEVQRVMLPDRSHHVMLDRPLVLVAALRALLAVWPG